MIEPSTTALHGPSRDEWLKTFHEQLSNYFEALAWSESINTLELQSLLQYLAEQHWLNPERTTLTPGMFRCVVSIQGYAKVEEVIRNAVSSQCFVAMWFDDSMEIAYDNAIAPAIRNAGYIPVRIDRKPDLIGKIDDAIVAEIRRSRFAVADFTHGIDGARGGVYFEAGFALGLNIPVIFTCREDDIDKVHFDTRQFNHILWNDTDLNDFRKRLQDRIEASILNSN